jgi:hypothetical protein
MMSGGWGKDEEVVAGLGDEEGFGFFGEEDEYSYVF